MVPERFRVCSVFGTKSVILALLPLGQLLRKASVPREVTELGMVIDVKRLRQNARLLIETTESGMVTEVN